MKANFLIPACIFICCITSCINNNSKVYTTKAKLISSYPTPKGWTEETMPFPIVFAPQITYTGKEQLRFAPGWQSVASEEHWTYTFLWWLNDRPEITSDQLKQNLTDYYEGLVGRNIRERMIPVNKVTPIAVNITEKKKEENDEATYTGVVTMTDYLDVNYSAVTLHVVIHQKKCGEHTALIFQISPQPFQHQIWKQLNDILQGFFCATD